MNAVTRASRRRENIRAALEYAAGVIGAIAAIAVVAVLGATGVLC